MVTIKRQTGFFWEYFSFLLSSRIADLVLLLLDSLCSAQSAGTTGSDETNLATSRCVPPDGGGFTNMLMVTTTEGMLNGLHREERPCQNSTGIPIIVLIILMKYTASITSRKTLHIKYRVRTFMATPRTRGQQFLLALYLW